ncbi:MAG: hypothetical protein EA401_14855 [Planctomycetota bacterium]|nr:MAG: hypothetical protein EA401_14855 [Planctomycetota bacterium]
MNSQRLAVFLSKVQGHGQFRIRFPSMLFLCGKNGRTARSAVINHITSENLNILPIIADDIWNSRLAHLHINALEMETTIARLSDCLLLFAESPGSWAELGAFSAIQSLSGKVVAPSDIKYILDESFINSGPMLWLSSTSTNGGLHPRFSREADFTDCSCVIDAVEDLLGHLDSISREHIISGEFNNPDDIKFLFVGMIIVIYIFAPLPLKDLHFVMKSWNNDVAIKRKLSDLVDLAKGMGIVNLGPDDKNLTVNDSILGTLLQGVGGFGDLEELRLSVTGASAR